MQTFPEPLSAHTTVWGELRGRLMVSRQKTSVPTVIIPIYQIIIPSIPHPLPMYDLMQSSQQPYEVGITFSSLLHMGKLRPRV